MTKILSVVHHYQLIIISQKLLSLKIHVIYFKMHSSFLHGLKVTSHCEVLVNLSREARKFCACQVSFLVLIIGSNDILDLDMTQRQAVSVIINIALLDHIKIMAVTVALI